MAEPETFDLLPGFDAARLNAFRVAAIDVASTLAEQLVAEGFTGRQAASLAAHFLLDAAWLVASVETLSEGREPDPTKFVASARKATDRLDMDATKIALAAVEAKRMGASDG